jgi:cellulose synthase/poly-beta-1,6-N-acetylglucosamine synthase-like glycosyltransferase/spore germination protein YaaH/peptidoglycan/xylan/chitin deacetylase (PgdA/CDA1 family)
MGDPGTGQTSMPDYIFHDPTGRRAKQTGLAGGLLIAVAALMVAGFFATLAFAPRLPAMQLRDPRVLTALHQESAHRLKRGKPAWTRIPRPVAARGGHAPAQANAGARPLTVGFYVSWDDASRESLRKHVESLDVVAPQWIGLNGPTGDVTVTPDARAEAIIAGAKHRPSLLPVVHNAKDAVWNGPEADAVILDPVARQKLFTRLINLANTRGYAGYVFDLENLSPRGAAAYPAFLAQAKAAFAPSGRDIWLTAPIDDEAWPLKKLQAAADVIVLMAYDEHYGTGDPGPPAGQDWFQSHVAAAMAHLDPSKTVLALGSYGYDWALASKFHPKGAAGVVTFNEATQNAHDSEAPVTMDEASLNPNYAYEDETGRRHSVWFLDAPVMYNQIKVADGFRPLGYGVWRLGSEDPGIWKILPHAYGQVRPTGLEDMTPGQDVDFDGTGEVLKVTATPTPGKRSLTFDKASGLISAENYDVMPTSYVIQRYGAHPGLVALTFDDGPDGRWTPKILDILKAKNAKATFFLIGQNMERFPRLVQREVEEGQMVGSHTWTHPNIAEVPATQARIELSATQRLFETLTGKSMRLFRPPFFGDAEPSTPREVAPLLLAQQQGYMTVGLRIDPDDWKKPDPDLIVSRALDRLDDVGPRAGQIILLHDSGGDRSRTVAALPVLIDQLRAHGYKLVTVDELAGMTKAQALPPTSRDSFELALDRMGFGFFHGLEAALRWLFITAIALGVARILVLGVLALVHRARIDKRTPPLTFPEDGPVVSVLIPCFNEEKVIAASVNRILASRWPGLEVIVLDDGSKDATAQVVRDAFKDEPRVTLLSFENGGKARALNRGLEHAKGEIIVALDADTLFPPDTIARLARWFADPAVGAVAGNAIVGNRVNLVTRWQALEYVTAQNLERRALAALGAVTVVPGAVGAWRKAALTELGGYPPDTLAEDQDLTLAVQRAGWRVEFDPEARAYTEAPDTVAGLLKQRYRWSFGTLQCLWKHRSALFNPKRPVLGFVALPQIWLFQILLTAVAPLVDLAVIWSLVAGAYGLVSHPTEWQPDNMLKPLFYWAAFIFLDLSAGALGMALERRAPWRDLAWLPAQRFGYRQLMYYVVMKSIDSAIRGARVGWGRLERRGSVAVEQAH